MNEVLDCSQTKLPRQHCFSLGWCQELTKRSEVYASIVGLTELLLGSELVKAGSPDTQLVSNGLLAVQLVASGLDAVNSCFSSAAKEQASAVSLRLHCCCWGVAENCSAVCGSGMCSVQSCILVLHSLCCLVHSSS